MLFVPGNHEYDLLEFSAAHQALKDACSALGITWLERETLVLQGIRFIGTTLWTDFEAFATGNTVKDIKSRDKAFKAANFWLQQAAGTHEGELFLAPQMRDLALQCQTWLRAALEQPFDGKTVVITHFAPSLQSADKRYGLQPGTAGFCNALDELLPHADLWMHGHLHCPHDYQAGRCRVVANPLGYARKGEQEHFNAERVFAI